jgi:ribosomal protein L32
MTIPERKKIYYCESCDQYIRLNAICPTCGQAGDELGWLVTYE